VADVPSSTRDRLVALAAKVFAEEGYAGVAVRDLAARSGVTSGAIYGNFSGKADLLLAAIDAHIEADLMRVPPEGLETLAEVDSHIFAHYPEREQLRALLVEGAVAARRDSEVRDRLGADHSQRLDQWTDVYRTWQDRGEIAGDLDVRAVVITLWSIELGLGVLEALGIDMPAPDDVARVIERLFAGLGDAAT
jgi:AcrR family transcriptional regulator